MRSILVAVTCLMTLVACQPAGGSLAVQNPNAPSVSATSQGASSATSAAAPEKPWKANLKWIVTRLEWPEGQPPFSGATSTFGGRCSVPSDYVIYARFEGEATHAGRFSGDGSHCSQLHLTPSGPKDITYSDGKGSFVSANGSTVRIEWGNGTSGTDEKGVTWFKDQFKLVGGTGTFEGVTGGGTEGGSFTDFNAVLAGTPAPMWQEGTITYKAGKGN